MSTTEQAGPGPRDDQADSPIPLAAMLPHQVATAVSQRAIAGEHPMIALWLEATAYYEALIAVEKVAPPPVHITELQTTIATATARIAELEGALAAERALVASHARLLDGRDRYVVRLQDSRQRLRRAIRQRRWEWLLVGAVLGIMACIAAVAVKAMLGVLVAMAVGAALGG